MPFNPIKHLYHYKGRGLYLTCITFLPQRHHLHCNNALLRPDLSVVFTAVMTCHAIDALYSPSPFTFLINFRGNIAISGMHLIRHERSLDFPLKTAFFSLAPSFYLRVKHSPCALYTEIFTFALIDFGRSWGPNNPVK